MGSKNLNLLEIIIALITILVCTYFYDVSDVYTPDGALYEGLAENLVNGTGYIDNIRNDFILPSIGHPFLILIFKLFGVSTGLIFGKLMFGLSLGMSVLLVRALELKRVIRLAVVPILYFVLPMSYYWGVEMSLFFVIISVFTCVVWFWKKRTWLSALCLVVAITLHLLVRPIGLPIMYLALFMLVIAFWKHRKRIIKPAFVVIMPLCIFQFVGMLSNNMYQDDRLITGTYSDIPLYCANNEYIDLKKNYFSSNWKEVSPELYDEAVGPMLIQTTWKDRSQLLKAKTVEFMKSNPSKAFGGFFWRLKQYTINQPRNEGVYLFYAWLIGCLLFIMRFRINLLKDNWALSFIAILVPIAVVCLTALFPYTGERYNLSPNIYFLVSVLLMLAIYSANIGKMKYSKFVE